MTAPTTAPEVDNADQATYSEYAAESRSSSGVAKAAVLVPLVGALLFARRRRYRVVVGPSQIDVFEMRWRRPVGHEVQPLRPIGSGSRLMYDGEPITITIPTELRLARRVGAADDAVEFAGNRRRARALTIGAVLVACIAIVGVVEGIRYAEAQQAEAEARRPTVLGRSLAREWCGFGGSSAIADTDVGRVMIHGSFKIRAGSPSPFVALGDRDAENLVTPEGRLDVSHVLCVEMVSADPVRCETTYLGDRRVTLHDLETGRSGPPTTARSAGVACLFRESVDDFFLGIVCDAAGCPTRPS